MIFAFENIDKFGNFVDSWEQDKIENYPVHYTRLPPSPTFKTMYKMPNYEVEAVKEAKDKYIIATGLCHHPEQWIGNQAKLYFKPYEDGRWQKEVSNFKSIFEWLSPKYLQDLQDGKAMLMLDQVLEGDHADYLWEYFHNECMFNNINPRALIYITGNGNAEEEYKNFCDINAIDSRMCIAPIFHQENTIHTVHMNNAPYGNGGLSFEDQLAYKQSNLCLDFSCLQLRSRAHRLWLFNRLRQEKLLEKGVCSMQPFVYQQTFMEDKRIPREDILECNKLLPLMPYGEGDAKKSTTLHINKLNQEVLLNSYVSVVSEAHFEHDTCFLSEKTFKPIVSHSPFMIYGNKGSLKMLHSIGYKTFGDYIDESYDDLNTFERLEKIVANIKEITKIKDKVGWYRSMEGILRHNYKTLYENVMEKMPYGYTKIKNHYEEYFK